MKIFINGRFLTQSLTGVQRYAFQVVKALDHQIEIGDIDTRDYEIFLISPNKAAVNIQLNHITQVSYGFTRGHIWEQFELPVTTKSKILWSPANTGPLITKRHIVTIHDASTLDHPEWFTPAFSKWYRILLPALMRRAVYIITDSQFSKNRLLSLLPDLLSNKVVVIHPGVDEFFRPVCEKEIERICKKFSLPRKFILTVGSLEPRKNLTKLFNSWNHLYKDMQGMPLVVAGGFGRVFRSINLSNSPLQVRLLGYVNDKELRALYTGAFAFIYPSLYEGFGLPPLEAMACGTPVVISNTASLPEVAGDAAFYIEPDDVNSIGYGIRRIVEDDQLRSQLILEGFKQAKKYQWESTSKSIWQLIQSVSEKS